MSKDKKKGSPPPPSAADGWRLIPPASNQESKEDAELEAELDASLQADLEALMAENPELLAEGFEALNRWRQEFFEEHGREPTEEDFIEYIDMIALDEDDWEEILDAIDDPELKKFLSEDPLAEDEDDES